MLDQPFAPWPNFTQEEVDVAANVIASNRVNYWTGQEGREFEREFAEWVGVRRAIALANGTLALDVALKALDIGPGADVIVTPRTFIASISTVVLAGARPIFADVDPDSGNITPESVAAVLTPRTRAAIVVHLGGWPADMSGFQALSQAHDVAIIEDCAQAHGAVHRGRSVGSWGAIAAWSFCQDKIMSTGGEGGMVTTDDETLWSRMWSYKDHGKSFDAVYHREHPPGFRWLHESFGTNWRMLEVQAAIGRVQLGRMAAWTQARTANATMLLDVADRHPVVRAPRPAAEDTHAYYKLYLYVEPARLASGWSRDRIIAELAERGVPAFQGSCSEVYLEKAFDGTGWRPDAPKPVAHELGQTSLMFLVHPGITAQDIARAATALDEVLTSAAA